ncbi:hypothetical protein FRB94_003587 [Tulasnella sp. JGI-2019a]|nr:hypothetical protein FRB93_002582 [Tulasnella sp. JGI-2019a]KAG9013147.1 hypothetical protein FRB94_003587 [Tulasnella sp. JGI-2019a]KAG9032182.1 hypothetical protein FRB95_001809 [Tulasnella sp. JGI-2019a]
MDNLAALPLSTITLSGIALYILGSCTYNLWFHPLRHIPGPWYAAISPVWLTFQDLKLKRAYALQDMLVRYGGIVRIHPNQVVYVDSVASRVVYSKCPKSATYKAFLTNDGDNALTILDNANHAIRKRAYRPHYTAPNLALYQPEIHEFTHDAVDKMLQCDGKKPIDCLILFSRLLTDITFMSSFGQRTESVKNWDIVNLTEDPANEIIDAIHLFPIRGILRAISPQPLWILLNWLPFPTAKKVLGCDNRIASYVIRSRNQVIENDPNFKLTGEKDEIRSDDERLSLIHRLLLQSLRAKPEDKLSDDATVAESMAHTIAGVDTSSITLAYMIYNLARMPDVLARIREEVDPLMPMEDGRHQIPSIVTLENLPYLKAFFMESMRLYGAVPSMLERVVPPTLDVEFSIRGFQIPPGTIVGTQAWSVHRDPSIFPDPEAFKPERWLTATEDMRSHWMAFGVGSRSCAGVHLAQIFIRVIIVAICRNFDLEIPASTTPESMEQRFAFAMNPAGRTVPLVFKPRRD